MAEIIQESHWEDIVEYCHEFDYVDSPGSGSSFPCDAQGNLFEPEHPSYKTSLANVAEGKMIDMGIVKYERSYRHPAVIKCDVCKQAVTLDDAWLNTCAHCNTDYNGSGQRLAPRSHWGEETGESLADILGPGDPGNTW